jgi:hypothetical protein
MGKLRVKFEIDALDAAEVQHGAPWRHESYRQDDGSPFDQSSHGPIDVLGREILIHVCCNLSYYREHICSIERGKHASSSRATAVRDSKRDAPPTRLRHSAKSRDASNLDAG